jgi:polygalacturonase
MSIGSETYGTYTDPQGVTHRGVENILVYDLTIDGDSRPVGEGSSPADSNGIRIKSDSSRGGLVNNVRFDDVCMRDVANAIMITPAYNPLFAGQSYPEFKNIEFHGIHDVTCMSTLQPVVTLEGFNAAHPAGPITLDNVVVDNTGPQAVAAAFADIRLGPGNVNFAPSGLGVTVTNGISGPSTPRACHFPTLPAPELPAGWLR